MAQPNSTPMNNVFGYTHFELRKSGETISRTSYSKYEGRVKAHAADHIALSDIYGYAQAVEHGAEMHVKGEKNLYVVEVITVIKRLKEF